MREVDIEDINKKVIDVLSRDFSKPTLDDIVKYEPIIKSILNSTHVLNESELRLLKRQYKFNGKRSFLFHIYLELKKDNQVDTLNEDILRKTLQIKPCKSWSGIVTVTIFTSAYPEYTNNKGERVKQDFSCAFSCSYCPKSDNMPRSYLELEPGVLRASRNKFDCALQIWDRMNSLYMTGHPIDKVELIVSGGTWTSYPIQYREEFCRDIYYATNTFYDSEPRRNRLSLSEEKLINQTAISRIVGLTIETRPDTITNKELKLLRSFGVTRVQLGIQHIDDNVLNIVNRKCTTKRTINAIKLLKESCFKIDGHWMLNLPGSTSKDDDNMLNNVLLGLSSPIKYETKYEHQSWSEYLTLKPKKIKELWEYYDVNAPEFQLDTWKIYPTAITPFTEILEWFKNGKYVPYDGNLMFDILTKTMKQMYPWIRIARVIRDIPEIYMYNENTGSDNTNMRQELQDMLIKQDIYCMDIRNREVKNKNWDGSYVIVIRKYNGSGADEYFISAESIDKKTLYGFVRLRLDHAKNKAFEELEGAALIREVHVYGNLTKVGQEGKHVQHCGIGRTLMKRAEALALKNEYNKIAVIAAEGNKKYYEKLGYKEHEYFMIKHF